MSITVVIPAHPSRARCGMLGQALESVNAQELLPEAVIVEIDHEGNGAPLTRHKALMKATTEWVAFLDSDDAFMPEHLRLLKKRADQTGADYVYSHYQVVGGRDPRPWSLGKVFDPDDPHQTTVVTLVKTELAQSVGFDFDDCKPDNLRKPGRQFAAEDWLFTQECNRRGARIIHLPRRTWLWRHHGVGSQGVEGNTSGLPQRQA